MDAIGFRDLVLGKRRYQELTSSPERIASNILADKLKKPETAGLVSRQAYQRNPARYESLLTEKGEGLKPVLEAIIVGGEAVPEDQEIPSRRARLTNMVRAVRGKFPLKVHSRQRVSCVFERGSMRGPCCSSNI